MMALSRRAVFLSGDGNLPYLLSGAANSTFMKLPLIRHDSYSSAFPAYVISAGAIPFLTDQQHNT